MSAVEEFIIRNDVDRSCFVTEFHGEEAVLDYQCGDGTLELVRTFVPPSFRGKGIAAKLVDAAFQYAQETERKVIPTCSYVATYLTHHPEKVSMVVSSDNRSPLPKM